MARQSETNRRAESLRTEIEAAAASARSESSTYGQILKSSALIGGSSLLNVGIGIVRTKIMAVLLGPAGFGLLSLYGSILELAVSIAGLGVNSSGVRQIAEAAGSGDIRRVSLTAEVLRRTSLGLGLAGAVLFVLLSSTIGKFTFGTEDYSGPVALLCLAILFRLVTDGQRALIQGMRRIGDMAMMNVLGALFGAIASIALVFVFGDRGLVPSLVAGAAVGLCVSWWYSRRLVTESHPMSGAEARHEFGSLLKLGFAFMGSGILMMGASYVVRLIVVRQVGLEAAGLYQAAWAIGGLYVGFILQAMGADFYPRLVGAANDHPQCNRLVNEQAHVGLVLAGPGVIATLTLAPWILSLLYSSEFSGAVEVLRWICLGVALRVITWPIGYIIVAKNRQVIFLGAEVAWTIVNVALTWWLVGIIGLNGAGIAFFLSYVFHGFMIYPIVRRLSGFRWSSESLRSAGIFIGSVALVFSSYYVVPLPIALALGLLVSVLSGIYSIRVVTRLIAADALPRQLRSLMVKIGLLNESQTR